MPLPPRGRHLVLLCVLLGSAQAVNNDATEALDAPLADGEPAGPSQNGSFNRARNGGRRWSDAERGGPEQSQVGCRELRSTKYISDGQCTSLNPIKELVCAGECLPAHLLPNWIGGGSYTGRYWSRREAQEWRCVTDRTRTQRIRLQCRDGSARTYKITVVTSCKCKRYSRQQNDSVHKAGARVQEPAAPGSKRRKEQRRMGVPEDLVGEQSN